MFSPIGDLSLFDATATGLAVLAYMNEADVDEILSRDLPKFSDTTPSDPSEMRLELERIRQRGYSVNLSQHRVDAAQSALSSLTQFRLQ
jgi:IclR family acetate operon transcriptional repressor